MQLLSIQLLGGVQITAAAAVWLGQARDLTATNRDAQREAIVHGFLGELAFNYGATRTAFEHGATALQMLDQHGSQHWRTRRCIVPPPPSPRRTTTVSGAPLSTPRSPSLCPNPRPTAHVGTVQRLCNGAAARP